MSNNVEYVGKDLESMGLAVNYRKWIFSLIEPYLGKHLVEVGAGAGSFSELLLEAEPLTLTLVEPSQMYEILENNEMIFNKPATAVTTHKNIFANIALNLKRQRYPDTIIYINVLEHITDDLLELNMVNETLAESGRLIVFVPALSFLFSDFDRHIGHFRRYSKTELISKFRKANFRVVDAKYFDFAGIVPWFIKYRIFKSLNLESGAVRNYDRSIVPIARFLEKIISPPIGKNLLLIGEKL